MKTTTKETTEAKQYIKPQPSLSRHLRARVLAFKSTGLFCVLSVAASIMSAADIKFVGTVGKAEVTHWQTASEKKSKALAGDVYGKSLGAINWKHGSTGEQDKDSQKLGWALIDAKEQYSKDEFVSIDDLKDATNSVPAGLVLDNVIFQLTGTDAEYAGKTVRLGVMVDVLGAGERAGDKAKGAQLVQTSGTGNGDSGVQSFRAGAAGTGSPEIYFFDITNIKAGDTFTLKALNNLKGKSKNRGYAGPLCWDIATTPAPTKSGGE